MLKVTRLSHPSERLAIFDSISFDEQTWLVSDLKTKAVLQDRLLDRQPMIEDETVLRASELWRLLFFRHFPAWRVLSADLTKTLFQKWGQTSSYSWARSKGAANDLVRFVQLFGPVFETPESHEQLGEWFKNQPMSFLNWGEWYLLAREYWFRMREINWVPSSSMSAHLVNVPHFNWNRPMVLDLGAELTPFEAELLERLSKQVDVHVLLPEFSSKSLGQFYERFPIGQRQTSAAPVSAARQQVVKRFATSLSEVKDCVHQVRHWIEVDGVQPHRIAIVAAETKPFERVFDFYFAQEGIPFSSDATSSLPDLPGIGDWLARLSLTQGLDSASLEQVVFHHSQKPVIDIETFRRLYTHIYSKDDLERNRHVLERIQQLQVSNLGDISRDAFVLLAIRLIPGHSPLDRIENFLKAFLLDVPENLELSMSGWLSYARAKAVKSEIKLTDTESGVRLLKVDAFEDLEIDCAYVLDLSEARMKAQDPKRIGASDVHRLALDLGWPLGVEDPQINEWKVQWALRGISKSVLAFSSTDWSGQPQAPALIWLDACLESSRPVEEVDRPRATVWDAMQTHARDASFRDLEGPRFETLKHRIDQDRGKEKLPMAPFSPVHLSASGIEDYKKCPFVYAAKRVFGLADYSPLDLDIDPMTKGSLIHRAFEKLLQSKNWQVDHSDKELEHVLDESAQDIQLRTRGSAFWPAQRTIYVKILKKFLAFEVEWRKLRPRTQTVGFELEVDGFYDPKTQKFSKSKTEGAVAFRGRIDRVDRGSTDELCLIDYKSSGNGLSRFSVPKEGQTWSWIEKRKYQLGLYALAVEAGLTELAESPVSAVAYFDFKKMERKIGFRCDSAESGLFLTDEKYPTSISENQKQEFLSLTKQVYHEVLDLIRQGEFAPLPAKTEDCAKCQWRTVCRASHLN